MVHVKSKFTNPRSCSVLVLVTVLLVFVAAALAQQGADDSDTCPSDSTPSDMLGPFYVEGSPSTTQIAPTELLQDPATRLSVSGRVLSLLDPQGADADQSSCAVGIPNVTVEVWYAGPPDAQGNYYRTDAFRGQMETDECGRYSFVQVFPAQYPTRPILHDHFRLSADGTELLVTQLYFRLDDGANQTDTSSSGQDVTSDGYVARDDAYPLQSQPVQHNSDRSRSVVFDLYLDNVQAGTVSTQSISANTASLCPAAGGSSNQTGSTSGQQSNSSETTTDGGSGSSSTTSGGSYPSRAFATRSAVSASVAALLLLRPW